MILSRCRVFAALLVFSPALFSAPAKKPASRAVADSMPYKSAIVVDAATGVVLFEDRADVVSPPASMTKLMTFAVLHDRLATGAITLETPVRIAKADAGMAGTQVFLDPRETFPIEELIYAMMVQSANDAAHALARASAGSVPAFVELMNAKARDLGMTHTTFRSPHGLPPTSRKDPDGDLTTPRDFAVLCGYLLARTDVLKYSSVAKRDFAPNRRGGPFKMSNHNYLLGKVDGVDGLKTGFTENAGYCISATAQRAGRRVIVVIMGALGAKGQLDYGRARDARAIELIERGFAALPAVASVPVINNGALKSVPVIAIPAPAAGPRPAPTPAPAPAPAESSGPPVKFSIPKK